MAGPLGQRNTLGQNYELVPPRDDRPCHSPAECHAPPDAICLRLIADPMAKRVIGVLEVVQIDEIDGQSLHRSGVPAPTSARPDRGSAVGSPNPSAGHGAHGGRPEPRLLALCECRACSPRSRPQTGDPSGWSTSASTSLRRPVPAEHAELERGRVHRARPGTRPPGLPHRNSRSLRDARSLWPTQSDEILRLVLQQILDRRRHK